MKVKFEWLRKVGIISGALSLECLIIRTLLNCIFETTYPLGWFCFILFVISYIGCFLFILMTSDAYMPNKENLK